MTGRAVRSSLAASSDGDRGDMSYTTVAVSGRARFWPRSLRLTMRSSAAAPPPVSRGDRVPARSSLSAGR